MSNKNHNQNPDLTAFAEDVVDLEQYAQSGKTPELGKKYKVKIDNGHYVFDHHIAAGKEILEKAGKTPVECHILYQKLKGCDFEKISLDDKVDLAKPGIEHFVVKPPEAFHYTVDGEPETTDEKVLTPTQILELAGIKPVSDYYLVLKKPDGTQISYQGRPNEQIKMLCPAMQFVAIFNGEMPVS